MSDELRQFLKNVTDTTWPVFAVTTADAQAILAQTSPDTLGQQLEKVLFKDYKVKSLSELDLPSVYDDLAKELDGIFDEVGNVTLTLVLDSPGP